MYNQNKFGLTTGGGQYSNVKLNVYNYTFHIDISCCICQNTKTTIIINIKHMKYMLLMLPITIAIFFSIASQSLDLHVIHFLKNIPIITINMMTIKIKKEGQFMTVMTSQQAINHSTAVLKN